MAALQDINSQLQLASTLSPNDIPTKLRCASCNKMAVFAWKMMCCDQMICDQCHQGLANKCLVCEHTPMNEDSSSEAKNLRTTIRAFLKKEQVRQEKAKDQSAPPVPIAAAPTPATEPEMTPQASIEVDEPPPTKAEAASVIMNGEHEKADDTQADLGIKNEELGAEDDDDQSDAESDSSSVQIHLGDDDDHLQQPTYGPNSVTQQQEQEMGQQLAPTGPANGNMQNGGYVNGQNGGIAGFGGSSFDPAAFQQMQQMMMQGGMNGMAGMNMMGTPGIADMSSMMQMFNNQLNSFGMNGMNGMPGMNMGMNGMGYGNMGNFGGNFNSQMSGNFGGNGYYPNGGYNQRHMNQFQNQNQYQRGFRRGNYQQRGSYGRGYTNNNNNINNRNNYYDQQNQYGQNDWSNQGDQSMQDTQMQGMNGNTHQNNEQQVSGVTDATEVSQQDSQQDSTGYQDPAHPNTTEDAAADSTHTDAVPDDAPHADALNNSVEPGPENPLHASSNQQEDDSLAQDPTGSASDSAQQYLQMHGQPSQNDGYDQALYQNQFGQPGRGRPFARGRGGWRGRGSFGGYGPTSHAQSGAAVTLISSAPPENAPTGPKAMREGPPASFGGRGGFRGVPNGPSTHAQVNGDHSSHVNEDTSKERSRSHSRARSTRDESDKRSRYRDRSYSDREEDHDRRRDGKDRRSSHKYEDEVRYDGDERHKEDVQRSRDASVESSRHRSSRRDKDKDKHRSSRSHRDRSREHKHKRRRSRSPETRDEQRDDELAPVTDITEAPSSETSRRKSKSERNRPRDRDDEYEREKDKKRDKDRHRDRSKDRKRKRSGRDRSASPTGEHHSDEDDHRSSRRSRKDKKARYRERDGDANDDAYEGSRRSSKINGDRDDYEERKDSKRGSKGHRHADDTATQTPSAQADDVGFSILGRSGNRNKTEKPPTGPASMRPPPTGPRAQGKTAAPTPPSAPSADRHGRRFSESSNKSSPQTPITPATPAVDPYQAEREKRNRERMAREQQRGQKQDDFAPPTGPRRRH